MPKYESGRLVHPIVTNESIAIWLGITKYEAHVLMHAIDEAYIVHSKDFTMSIFDIADALFEGLGVFEHRISDEIKFTYVKRSNTDNATLIFNWQDHVFYISNIYDFKKAMEGE